MQEPFDTMEDNFDDQLLAVPAEAFDAIDADCEAAGGEFNPQEQAAGSIGRTMFDSHRSEDGTVTVLLPQESLDQIFNQSLVGIKSRDGREYLGVVVEGPFAEPDGLRAGLATDCYQHGARRNAFAEVSRAGSSGDPR